MAIPEANLDEYDKEARDVLGAAAPQSGDVPDLALEEDNPTPPTSQPAEGPEEFGGLPPTAPAAPPEEVPAPSVVPVTPTETPIATPPATEALAQKQGALDVEKAKIDAATAGRMAQEAQTADEDARLERAEYLQRRQDAEKDLDDRIKAYSSTKLTDPRDRGVKSTLAVIFGGLGAGLSAAGGGSGQNAGLAALQKKWEDNTELQKANISALRDKAIMARTRLENVDEGRRTMLRDADARLVAKYNLALKQGEAQLRNQGANQAQIDADGRIVKLRAGQAAAKIQAQKDEDAHLLNQARIGRLNAAAARDAKKGKGKGGGGGGGALQAFVAAANQLEPGEQISPEVAALGARAGLKPNQIATEVDRYRGTGGKSAKSGAGGIGSVRQNAVLGNIAEAEKAAKDIGPVSLSSIDTLRKNENWTERAKSHGIGGIITQGAQAIGAAPRGRYEGIPGDEQRKITAAEQVITHLTEMQQGKNIETLEQYRERYSPYVPGLDEAEVRRREAALPGLVAEQRAIQDPQSVGLKRQAAGEARKKTGGADIDAERLRKAKAAMNNPDAPPAVRQEAAKFIKQAIRNAGKRTREAPADNGGEPLDDIVL